MSVYLSRGQKKIRRVPLEQGVAGGMCLASVAVITYNMEKYLPALLNSILKQKVDFKYEIVIDDDFSPDGSRNIIREYVRKYPAIVKPRFRTENVGGSRNMFGVMQSCRGKYIAILEGDDFWEDENKLQYQVDFLEKHDEYIGMCCNSWCEHGETADFSCLMRNRHEPRIFTIDDFDSRHFLDRLPSSTDTWVFRNFFKDGGDYSLLYKAHPMIWDQALVLILYSKGKIYADPKIVSHHRSVVSENGSNYQSVIKRKNCLLGDSRMYQAMEEFIHEKLHMRMKTFLLQRKDVWIESFFWFLKSNKREDWEICKCILAEQECGFLLITLLLTKFFNIGFGKLYSCVTRVSVVSRRITVWLRRIVRGGG